MKTIKNIKELKKLVNENNDLKKDIVKNKEFFNLLADKLEELFPKLNHKDISKKSPNHRSEALSLKAFANVYHNRLLSQATTKEREECEEHYLSVIDDIHSENIGILQQKGKELVEAIKEKKKKGVEVYDVVQTTGTNYIRGERYGHNQALKDTQSLIKEIFNL